MKGRASSVIAPEDSKRAGHRHSSLGQGKGSVGHGAHDLYSLLSPVSIVTLPTGNAFSIPKPFPLSGSGVQPTDLLEALECGP